MKRSTQAEGSPGHSAKDRTARAHPPFFWIALPEFREHSRRITPYLVQIKGEVLEALESSARARKPALMFFAERQGGVWPPPVQVDEEAERRALRTSITNLLDARRSNTATVSLGGGLVMLHVLDKTATVDEYLKLLQPDATQLESERVPRPEIVDNFNHSVASKLADLPQDFAARREALRALHLAARSAIAESFEAALNREASERPQQTYEDKKALAKWVNAELRELGLTVRCPKTGRPAFVRGHAGGTPGVGRFHLEITDERGVQQRTVTSVNLPYLNLEADDLARAPYGERGMRGH